MGSGISQIPLPPGTLMCTYKAHPNSQFIPKLEVYAGENGPLQLELIRLPRPHTSPFRKNDIFDWETSAGIDSSAVLAPTSVLRGTIRDLVDSLCEGIDSTRDKTRVLYCWVTRQNLGHIDARDPNLSTVAYYLWRIKKGLANYAHLFSTMCRFANIPCVIIDGVLKGCAYKVGGSVRGYGANGQWNAVLIDDHWYFVDTFWGSCGVGDDMYDMGSHDELHSIERREFLYECDENYFLTDPDQLIATHFPRSQSWQLLNDPVSIANFEEMACVKNRFFDLGMSLLSHEKCVITCVNGEAEIKLGIHPGQSMNYAFRHVLSGSDADMEYDYEKYALVTKIQEDTLAVKVRLPKPGIYQLEIIGKDASFMDESYDYDWIILYKLVSKQTVCNCASWPATPNIGWGPGYQVKILGLKPESHASGYIQMNTGKGHIVFSLANQELIVFSHQLFLVGDTDMEYFDHVVYWCFDGKLIFYLRLPCVGTFALYITADEAAFCNYVIKCDQKVDHSPFPRDFGAGAGPSAALEKLKITPKSHRCPVISTHRDEIDIIFETPDSTELMGVLMGNTGSEMDKKKRIEQKNEDNVVTFRLHLPKHGYYRLRVVAIDSNSKDLFTNIYDYLVKYKKSRKSIKSVENSVISDRSSSADNIEGIKMESSERLSEKSEDEIAVDEVEDDEDKFIVDGEFLEINDQRTDGVQSRMATAPVIDEEIEETHSIKTVANSSLADAKFNMRWAIIFGDEQKMIDSIEELSAFNMPHLQNDIEKTKAELLSVQCLKEIETAMAAKDIDQLENAIDNIIQNGKAGALRKEMIGAQNLIDRLKNIERAKHDANEIHMSQIEEIKSYSNPPVLVKNVLMASLLLLGHGLEETKDWRNVLKIFAAPTPLANRIKHFDIDTVTVDTAREVRTLLNDVTLERARQVSAAIAGFYRWVAKATLEVERRN